MQTKALYFRIAENIKIKIHSNIYKKNERLPSEKDLCAEYDVRRETVKKAIHQLSEEGYLYTVAGKGTFVFDCVQDEYVAKVSKDTLFANGYDSADLVFANIVKPSVYDVYYMKVHPTKNIITMKWLVKRGSKPIAFDVKTLLYVPGIPLDESSLSYTDLCNAVPEGYMKGIMRQSTDISVILPPNDVLEHFTDEKNEQIEMVKVQISLLNVENEVVGCNIIYILPEEFTLRGESL